MSTHMQIQPYRGFLCVSGDHSHAESEFRIAMNTVGTVPPQCILFEICIKYGVASAPLLIANCT